jgi:hypothetical protein
LLSLVYLRRILMREFVILPIKSRFPIGIRIKPVTDMQQNIS